MLPFQNKNHILTNHISRGSNYSLEDKDGICSYLTYPQQLGLQSPLWSQHLLCQTLHPRATLICIRWILHPTAFLNLCDLFACTHEGINPTLTLSKFKIPYLILRMWYVQPTNTPVSQPAHDHDIPVAIRKGTIECTKYPLCPIAKLVTFVKFSLSQRNFLTSLVNIHIPNTLFEALANENWRSAMKHEMEAFEIWEIVESCGMQMSVCDEVQFRLLIIKIQG